MGIIAQCPACERLYSTDRGHACGATSGQVVAQRAGKADDKPLSEVLDELEGLLAKARLTGVTLHLGRTPASNVVSYNGEDIAGIGTLHNEARATAIVALVNHAPRLIAAARKGAESE